MMKNVIVQFIEYFKFTEGLSVSDIIGWSLTFLAGIIAFRLIDHLQTSRDIICCLLSRMIFLPYMIW